MLQEIKRWFTPKKTILLVVLLLIGAFFYKNTILATFYSFIDRWNLPHYAIAQKITESEFNGLQSDVEITRSDSKIMLVPGVGEKLVKYGVIKEYLEAENILINDKLKNTYYYQSNLSFRLDRTEIYKIEPNTGKPEASTFPFDDRWKATGGLSCFSCGCDCYMDKDLLISNDHYYVNVYGENFAIRSDRQGIYFLQSGNNTWVKLTPKIDGGIKVTDGGCVVSYRVGSEAFSLNACES